MTDPVIVDMDSISMAADKMTEAKIISDKAYYKLSIERQHYDKAYDRAKVLKMDYELLCRMYINQLLRDRLATRSLHDLEDK